MMKRNTWLGLSLAAALGVAGRDRPGEGHASRRAAHQKPGRTSHHGEGRHAGEERVQPEGVLKGLSITPRVEGDKVILSGNVPSKAHLVAAILAIYEIPSVRHVDCQLCSPKAGSRA